MAAAASLRQRSSIKSITIRRRTGLSRPPSVALSATAAADTAAVPPTPLPRFDDKDADYASRSTYPRAPQVVFPHVDGQFQLGDGAKQRVDARTVIRALWPVISDARRRKIASVVRARSYSLLPILEGTYDMGNISAVARSADAMGLGAMHIVATEGYRFKRSRRTSKGAEKWLDLWRWRADTVGAIAALKEGGYRVLVAMPPSERSEAMTDLNLGGPRTGGLPTAVVFGNELAGVSREALEMADGEVTIPMAGFSESLNVSVAATLLLAVGFRQRGGRGDLPAEQAELLTASYLLRAVQGRDMQWLLWLNPEQAREEQEAREELLAQPPGWRRRLAAKREERMRAKAEMGGGGGGGGGGSGSGNGSSVEEEEEANEDALTAEDSARVAEAMEELRRGGGGER